MSTSISLYPSTVARGLAPLALGVVGTGFAPGERVSIVVGGVEVCSCNADLSGNLATAIPNPATTLGSAASLAVTASSVNGSAQAQLQIT